MLPTRKNVNKTTNEAGVNVSKAPFCQQDVIRVKSHGNMIEPQIK